MIQHSLCLPACLLCAKHSAGSQNDKDKLWAQSIQKSLSLSTHTYTHACMHARMRAHALHPTIKLEKRVGPKGWGPNSFPAEGHSLSGSMDAPCRHSHGAQYLLSCATLEPQVCFYVRDNRNLELVLFSVGAWAQDFQSIQRGVQSRKRDADTAPQKPHA